MIIDNQAKQQWPGPTGLIPVTSGKAEDANIHNRNFFDHILVEMRVIDAIEPDLTTEIFGQKFSSPTIMAAFHLAFPQLMLFLRLKMHWQEAT